MNNITEATEVFRQVEKIADGISEYEREQQAFRTNLLARTPLTIVAHILPGLPVVVRPTLEAMGNIRAARYHGADAADLHRTATTEPYGEGRGCNC
jgi:hypothetical protein